ncbi:GNAT family N-acetyltransferase [Granulicella sp. dw_53]|uniref:GNAT family N-acetyltransferase n=1 Tax=Granulicella sp. dw_53 TaxID=2719792 RepID=UPI001BD5942A|nr:GNAT family N-acetyltransferase [Granulicella sp. dw_53]
MILANSLPGFRIEINPPKVDLADLNSLFEIVGMGTRSVDAMREAIKSSTEIVVVYNDRDILVGFGRLISDGAYYGTLWDIAVHPNFQKLGIGKMIVARLLAKCRCLQLRMVGLFTALHNRRFYESLGFTMLDYIHAMTLDLDQFEH